MSKFSQVVFSLLLATVTVSFVTGCAEQKGRKKDDKKADKKADKNAGKQE
jgi:hypothetical protein